MHLNMLDSVILMIIFQYQLDDNIIDIINFFLSIEIEINETMKNITESRKPIH